MNKNAIICLVAVIVLVVVIAFVYVDTSKYCNCTGMNTMVNSPPLNLWNAANGGMDAAIPGSDDYETLSTAYTPSMWGVIEKNVSTQASRGCPSTLPTTSSVIAAPSNKIVPLSTVGASVPVGAVSGCIASYPINPGYVKNGFNVSPNTIPGISYRYGTYYNAYNPDMKIGVM